MLATLKSSNACPRWFIVLLAGFVAGIVLVSCAPIKNDAKNSPNTEEAPGIEEAVEPDVEATHKPMLMVVLNSKMAIINSDGETFLPLMNTGEFNNGDVEIWRYEFDDGQPIFMVCGQNCQFLTADGQWHPPLETPSVLGYVRGGGGYFHEFTPSFGWMEGAEAPILYGFFRQRYEFKEYYGRECDDDGDGDSDGDCEGVYYVDACRMGLAKLNVPEGEWLIEEGDHRIELYTSPELVALGGPYAMVRTPCTAPCDYEIEFENCMAASPSCVIYALNAKERLNSVDLIDCGDLAQGLFAVQPADSGGLWGYMNLKGEIVIAAQFEEAYGFVNGRAAVKRNNLFGYIDEQGNEVISPQYRWAGFLGERPFVKLSLEQAKALCERASDTPQNENVLAACAEGFEVWEKARKACLSETDSDDAMKEAGLDDELCVDCYTLGSYSNKLRHQGYVCDLFRSKYDGKELQLGWAYIDAQGQLLTRFDDYGSIDESGDENTLVHTDTRKSTIDREWRHSTQYCISYDEPWGPKFVVSPCHKVESYADLVSDSIPSNPDYQWLADSERGGFGFADADGQWLVSYRLKAGPFQTRNGLTAFGNTIDSNCGRGVWTGLQECGWINADGKIIWPPGWNDPCADTGGIVMWPEGACAAKDAE